MKMNNVEQFISDNKKKLNEFAEKYINNNFTMPKELKDSIVYSLVNDGKKLRPAMFLAILNHYNLDYNNYLDVALALELIHTYSLVHDDLPAMDDDDYRWGKLTNHKVFGIDLAILTGDAMQTIAYEILTKNEFISSDIKVELISLLANYSGVEGMIGGQVYDVKQDNYEITADYLKRMHSLKTGKLIILPLIIGALVANKKEDLPNLIKFGTELGIAYQIKDDVLDYYGSFDEIGKMPSDENKKTYLSFYGIEKSEQLLKEHTNNAKSIAELLKNDFLYEFAELLLNRKK